jgi:hypothetical protein
VLFACRRSSTTTSNQVSARGWKHARSSRGPRVSRARRYRSCLLSVICCLLSAVCCMLSAVCCLLSAVVCCLVSGVCSSGPRVSRARRYRSCLLSAVCCLLSAVCCLLSTVCCCLVSGVCCLLSAVCSLLSAVCCWCLVSAPVGQECPEPDAKGPQTISFFLLNVVFFVLYTCSPSHGFCISLYGSWFFLPQSDH